jgi:type 1 glutamine amidotransferase
MARQFDLHLKMKNTLHNRSGRIMNLLGFLLSLSLLATGLTQAESLTNNHARVLLVTGQDYPGHPWRLTAPALASELRQDARLEVVTVEDPHFLDSEALAQYDVVVLHFMNWEQASPGEKARENLRRFVDGGKGLVLVHFACGAWQDWPGFADLAGRAWDPKMRPHDPRGVFQVKITDGEHPITRGMEAFDADDELYTCLAGSRPIHVLASARSRVDGKDYPMAFVLNHGKGRVFHSVLGHDLKAITVPGAAALYRRGTAWAAGLGPMPGR